MIAVSHATGNQNLRHAALAMAEGGLLAELWTAISWNDHSFINRLLPAGLRAVAAAFLSRGAPAFHPHAAVEGTVQAGFHPDELEFALPR